MGHSEVLQNFLLGRLAHPFNAYPETDLVRLTSEEVDFLRKAGEKGVLVGYGDVRYVLDSRRPGQSKTGLCESCEHRRAYVEKDRASAPRYECKELQTSKGVCYCWVLRKDFEVDHE